MIDRAKYLEVVQELKGLLPEVGYTAALEDAAKVGSLQQKMASLPFSEDQEEALGKAILYVGKAIREHTAEGSHALTSAQQSVQEFEDLAPGPNDPSKMTE